MMKRSAISLSLIALTGLFSGTLLAANLGSQILIGKVPGRYLSGKSKAKSYLAKVVIKKGVIKEVEAISSSDIAAIKSSAKLPVIELKEKGSRKHDVIYPGLVDLHNHTKQNMVSVWGDARGQFANRFEWRKWKNYKEALSNNMNPWIQKYGKVTTCAAFRWSELQAMVLGTTFLQGPSSCVKDFAINHVEGGDGFLYDKTAIPKLNVQGPTDVVYPAESTFIWDVVRKEMKRGDSFAKGLEKVIFKSCSALKPKIETAYTKSTEKLRKKLEKAQAAYDKKQTASTLRKLEDAKYNLSREMLLDKDVLKIVKNKATLQKYCSVPHDKFLRFMSFIYPSLAGKISYINHPHRSAVVAHLAEGRRLDPYNGIEFDVLKLMGLDQKHFNLVHAVGMSKEDFKHMAKKGMGLIWSPFSNFLLYGQTANILEAHKAGVTIALGSDWTPTGSKSVLEELKIARNYIKKTGLSRVFSDEYLYKMVTENSAEIINHLENDPNDGAHGIGKVVVDAAASLIVVKENSTNPHTNLVTADAADINLVIVNGDNKYGNTEYLQQANEDVKYEVLPAYFAGVNDLIEKNSSGTPEGVIAGFPIATFKESKAALNQKLVEIMISSKVKALRASNQCDFKKEKGFVHQDSFKANKGGARALAFDDLAKFEQATGLNLDRAHDITKLLGTLIMTQGKNILGMEKEENAIPYFSSLFSCNDKTYLKRFTNFMKPGRTTKDEFTENKQYRIEFRQEQQNAIDRRNSKSEPHKMAEDYGLEYNVNQGVMGY